MLLRTPLREAVRLTSCRIARPVEVSYHVSYQDRRGGPQYDVIYTRYSSEMQRPESCVDQERKVREGLERKGIPHQGYFMLKDEAMSGTRDDRPSFAWLRERIERGEVRTLAVDDQTRLSRSENVFDLIQDLVFSGGRFISTSEGIDTNRPGWEMQTKVNEVCNTSTNRQRADQVRRGKEGRVLADGSAGDFRFGYRSAFIDDTWKDFANRGPRPRKKVVVYEPEAKVVRDVFRWFIEGMSLGAIVRRLNDLGVDKGHRSWRPGWHHQIVRGILSNPKYIGEWSYGHTTTVRNSKKKKKQIPCDQVVHSHRPELRIIDDETWERAQKRLREIEAVYGSSPLQKRRGPKVHYSAVYPAGLLNGLLYCGYCGSRLRIVMGGKYKSFGCPLHPQGRCPNSSRVDCSKAEGALVDFVGAILREWPECLAAAISVMRGQVQEAAQRVPVELEALEKRRTELGLEIDRVWTLLAKDMAGSETGAQKVRELEAQARDLDHQIAEQRRLVVKDIELPDDIWVHEQLEEFIVLMHMKPREAALLLRELLGKVSVHEIHIPGKRLGYKQLRFTIQTWAALRIGFGDRVPIVVLQALQKASADLTAPCPEFHLDLGGPTKMDLAGPVIAELRAKGVKWMDIAAIVKLAHANAYLAYKRYLKGQAEGGTAASA